jgi:hypothetical protein
MFSFLSGLGAPRVRLVDAEFSRKITNRVEAGETNSCFLPI